MIATLVAVFVLSGAAGLIYESIWSRYLGLFVGHSAYAQIIVLVIFLGGMSLGAYFAGQRSNRVRWPLVWYAGVELVVGLLALLFHDAFVAVTASAYDSIFPALGGVTLQVVKWVIAGILILPQSILLGTTFPLMSAGVIRLVRDERSTGHMLALMYFANSIGAALGVLVAGFVLIEAFGLPGTLLIAGAINVVAACVVGLIARRQARGVALQHAPSGMPQDASSGIHQDASSDMRELDSAELWRVLLWVSFGTAVASFVYEIAWIRMLSMVLGSATHSFELMLSAFILGLALGALWIRPRADGLANPVRFLGAVQWAMGTLAVATLPLYLLSFDWIAAVLNTVQQNASGYRAFLLTRYAIALLVMLPATFCAGMTLPLITRILMRQSGERAIGAVYAVNTLGSIAGVILAGLVLMPVLGLKKLLVFGALIDIGLGVWLVALAGARRAGTSAQSVRSGVLGLGEPEATSPIRVRYAFGGAPSLAFAIAVTAGLLATIAGTARFDLARITSGVYRHGVVARSKDYTFPYYRDGRTATVSVRRGGDGFITLATNGKPDASMEAQWMKAVNASNGEAKLALSRDIATQLLLPIMTLAHNPTAKNVAVIGHGSGMTSHVILGSPRVQQVVTIEIEPEMIEASRLFRPANRRVFEDKRATFVIDDARSYFASSGRTFDIILSEPSNPWVSGVSGLFTQEFYGGVRRRLTEHGIFGQWLHLYELNDGLVTSVLAAIDAEFADYEIFFTSNADILVVAANHPLAPPDWSVTQFPGVAQDLQHVVPIRAESFEALRLSGRDVIHPMLLGHGAPNSDFFPVLDLGAERTRFMRRSAEGYTELPKGRFDVVAALSGRMADFGHVGVSATPEVERPTALALGTRLRAMRTLAPDVTAHMTSDHDLRLAMYRRDQLERLMATGRAPVDWHAWLTAVGDVDEDIHGGTAGVVDTAFFAGLRDFTTRTSAPTEVRAAIDFLHGIGSWNWPETIVSSRALMASRDSQPWLPDEFLRNGAAVAFIKLRDYEGARDVLRKFGRTTSDDPFRERLIASYLIYADSTTRKKMGWK
ncbi:MAG TPA: fused MFS/spermidine synthase [Gemmatimonadaceae bacterium]|nr:fused MFS/spermidine synthase [Gemmatimonadaceae bacterium]